MASLSDYAENAVLDHVLGTTAMPMPETVYIGLFTAAPDDAGGGTEVTGAGYARQPIEFDPAAGGETANSTEIRFPVSGGDFGTVSHWGLFDAATGGNMIWHGTFTDGAGTPRPRDYLDGDEVLIRTGQIVVRAD